MQRVIECFEYDALDRLVFTWVKDDIVVGEDVCFTPPEDWDGEDDLELPDDIINPFPGSSENSDTSFQSGDMSEHYLDILGENISQRLAGIEGIEFVGPCSISPGSQASYGETIEVRYDEIGNILSRSDVGRYYYSSTQPNGDLRAHAVSAIHSPWQGVNRFDYDGNGNLKSTNFETYDYTPFNRIRAIESDNEALILYEYDGALSLASRKTLDSTTIYVQGIFKDIDNVIPPEQQCNALFPFHYDIDQYSIFADGRVIAEVQRSTIRTIHTPPISEATQLYFFHNDHQNTTDLVTGEQGRILARFSYNAFGQRRSTDWRTGKTPPGRSSYLIGFTGHEDEQEIGLVNMNARIYDPRISRFMSPDPLVQFPNDGQGLNRYSYVRNNPVTYIDPTGFFETPNQHGTTTPVITYSTSYEADVTVTVEEIGQSIVDPSAQPATTAIMSPPPMTIGPASGNEIRIPMPMSPRQEGRAREQIFFDFVGAAVGGVPLLSIQVLDEIVRGEVSSQMIVKVIMTPFLNKAGGILKPFSSARADTTSISNAILEKGEKFFDKFANRSSFGHTTREIGRFFEFSVNVPGRVPGSFTRWVKVVNQDGRTVNLYHDTFDKTGKFINRGIKVPGPSRHVR